MSVREFIGEQIDKIKKQVGESQVICGLSGGVDSSVAAVLVHRAIGEQLTCVYVDNGFMRKGEGDQIQEIFGDDLGMKLVYVDARERFLQKLAGVTDPERKRKIIGEDFIRVFEEEAEKLGKPEYLVQGTILSDVMESGAGKGGRMVKSHHNVGGLPEDMQFQLVEPLRELYKEKVREVGEALGLPPEIVWRQPFPGPGLAVRIIGDITQERLELLRDADAIVVEEIKKAGLYQKLWQAFAILPVLRSVGLKDHERSYGYTVGIRAVTSRDAMTADWARLPYDLLTTMSTRIVNEVEGVNRVVYDITPKPPGTIEWE